MRKFCLILCWLFLLINNAVAKNLAHPNLAKKTKPVKSKVQAKVKKVLTDITTNKTSVMQKNLHKQKRALNNPLGILFYRPTYLLPFYYTGSPDKTSYQGNTPGDQTVNHAEFKFQFSFQLPVWVRMLRIKGRAVSLYASYTQLSYWQFYAKSQYFRETNYEPQIFLASNFYKNWLMRLGFDHQSNGRGGDLERSWNRLFMTLNIARNHWFFSFQPWVLIFKADSSDVHNPEIARYLGHERIIVAYKFNNHCELSLKLRNIEHIDQYMSEEATLAIPLTKHIQAYLQLFHGYGQSLIEYQHKTTSAGIGISLSNWL